MSFFQSLLNFSASLYHFLGVFNDDDDANDGCDDNNDDGEKQDFEGDTVRTTKEWNDQSRCGLWYPWMGWSLFQGNQLIWFPGDDFGDVIVNDFDGGGGCGCHIVMMVIHC